MKVRELIATLKKQPPEMEVRVWDADEDEFVPVTGAVFEDGSTVVTLLTCEQKESDFIEVTPESPGGHVRHVRKRKGPENR